ncbi:MAG: bifunctional diaminohydroxyphosphoribosylaminopyrimidine deaminase/5-amino-6-(5-phosphoribosylamino)uracil reductase RibD [Candidatus Goldbacteria bacterium]|nr:bifunctional diaminohydroxyphosphoribosylaminopyrimidine deaminase/5-amino-6-(5-phosphoribosylamino)uracil reductase RibD [Candidatus Goldiibacteriota bacterium]
MTPDEKYIKLTIDLALKAVGHTSPNPLVGCVIVKNNKIISTGFHKKPGALHAEAEAIKKAGQKAKNATLYVNLEPCVHTDKKTPPCVDAIIKARIKKVIASMKDPNPEVNGKGFLKLKQAGCIVIDGVLRKEAEELNRVFIKNMKEKMPYVIIKAGLSTDGKIALKNKKSKWITSKESREHSQFLRKFCDAIMVGINTILIDNPHLDCRIDSRKKIKKVVLDANLQTPINANIFKRSGQGDIIIFCSNINNIKKEILEKKGAVIIKSPAINGKIDENFIMKELFKRGIMSVLIEGGSTVTTSFLCKKLVDEAWLYIAPKIIGADGLHYFGKMGFKDMSKVFSLKNISVEKIKDDILLKGKVLYK